MVEFQAKLVEYLANRNLISKEFFTATVDAEETCCNASHRAHSDSERNAAQAAYRADIGSAAQVRTLALVALGPPPVMPIGYEPNGNSHETHNIEPYRVNQELLVAS